MSSKPILVFPVVNRDEFSTVEILKRAGHEVWAASSAPGELLTEEFFQGHFLLPTIYAADFVSVLRAHLDERGIHQVLCPVPSVYAFLANMVKQGQLDIQLLNDYPIGRVQDEIASLLQESRSVVGATASEVEKLRLASILYYTRLIFGQSSQDKIEAMVSIASTCPPGDIVEIGAFLGRTAFALAALSRYRELGNVLIIDPWDDGHMRQQCSESITQEEFQIDLEVVKDGFLVALLPFGSGLVNYLRLPSEKAYRVYAEEKVVQSAEFASTRYTGKISLLHIDGNHDYERAREDCVLWIPHVVKDGWLILDDYLWHHGQGPKFVGDWMLKHLAPFIQESFVRGRALFVRFNGEQDERIAECPLNLPQA